MKPKLDKNAIESDAIKDRMAEMVRDGLGIFTIANLWNTDLKPVAELVKVRHLKTDLNFWKRPLSIDDWQKRRLIELFILENANSSDVAPRIRASKPTAKKYFDIMKKIKGKLVFQAQESDREVGSERVEDVFLGMIKFKKAVEAVKRQ